MIIKSKDDMRPATAKLLELLALKSISKKQREGLEEELSRMRSGEQGEKEAAYQIDCQLKESRNWAVIHDLRLEHNGRVAEIDHLIIGRFFDMFVIESKNFTTALQVDGNGEFQARTRWGWKGMASPIEQNKRHIIVLNELIHDHRLTPMRLGLPIRPAYRNWILIPPECRITRRHIEEAIVLKMDMFDRRLREFVNGSTQVNDVLSVAKICSTETIVEFARKLVSFHRPASPDFAAKFGIAVSTEEETVRRNESRPLTKKTAAGPAPLVKCHQCGASVDAKVAALCRFNSRKFEKRILCRECQSEMPAAPRVSRASRAVPAKTGAESSRSHAR